MVLVKVQGEQDEKVQEFYIDGILKENLDFVKNRVLNKNADLTIVTDGRTGTGKTTYSCCLAKYLDPDFNLNKIVFSPEEFMKALQTAKKGDAIVFDEAMVISSRSAMSEYNKKVVQIMSQIRSKQLFIFFVLPSLFDLDRNLALHRVHMLVHCYSPEFARRGRFTAYFENSVKELYLYGKKFYSYSKPKPNFYGRFTKYFPLDWNEYESKKQKAINDLVLKPQSKRGLRFKRQRDNAITYFRDQYHLEYRKIAEIIGNISDREIGNIYRGER